MSLHLTYKAESSIPVDAEGLVPERVCGRSLGEIERQSLLHGNRRVPLAELFNVSGDADDGQLDLEGDLSRVHGIGAGLSGGTIRVHGSAGRHVGSRMTAGRIEVRGDAGDWLGSEMQGGEIHVLGDAGDAVGAALPGAVKGMAGGVIAVEGDAGHQLGSGMRRGLIAVAGKAGDMLGVNMLAGTILTMAGCGAHPGANMRRGTIVLAGGDSTQLLPTFRYACRYRPGFLPLVVKQLERCGLRLDPSVAAAEYDLFGGDMLDLGRGEIFVRA
jgi:formylmethanofuran dehydrogenase subunit C